MPASTRPRRAAACRSVLNADEFRRFYQVVDQAEDVQHTLMLRLLFYTAVRVSELCGIRLPTWTWSVQNPDQRGKGDKDR